MVGGVSILKSTNGGVDWLIQVENTMYSVNSVDYIDNNIGWVAGGLISNSTNGGNNWIIQKVSVKV